MMRFFLFLIILGHDFDIFHTVFIFFIPGFLYHQV